MNNIILREKTLMVQPNLTLYNCAFLFNKYLLILKYYRSDFNILNNLVFSSTQFLSVILLPQNDQESRKFDVKQIILNFTHCIEYFYTQY